MEGRREEVEKGEGKRVERKGGEDEGLQRKSKKVRREREGEGARHDRSVDGGVWVSKRWRYGGTLQE